MGATEDFIASLQKKGAARVGAALTLDATDPDAAAENLRLGSELGLPANIVSADPAGFKRQRDQRKAADALSAAPKTRNWLSDLNNGTLAKDDVENLSWFERMGRGVGTAYQGMGDAAEESVPGRMVRRGGLRATANVPQTRASAAAQVLADRGKSFDDIYAEIAGQYGDNAPASIKVTAQQVAKQRYENAQAADITATAKGGADALAEARGIMARVESLKMSDTSAAFRDGPLAEAPDTLGGLAEAIWSDPVGGAAFIAETAGEFLPVLMASAATTAVTRSPAAGVVALGSGSFLAENAASAQAFLSEKGVDMSTPEAALEVLNNAELMEEAGTRGATRGVIIAALDALSGGVAGQALVRNPGADILVQSLAQMALGGGGEALATAAVGDEINWKEVGLEALGEALTLPADVIIGGRTVRDLETSATSGTTAATIDDIDRMAAASKLKQRSPEKFAEALEAQGDVDFYVPATDLKEYFQAKDTFDDETLAAWGIDPMDFSEAESTGGDVSVSRATYAARISGGEDAAWFRDNATMSADEFSVSQAARFNSEVRDVMEKAFADAEAQRKDDAEVRASDVQVYDSMFTQLREAGRTRDVADNEARVWSSFWRTMGERYGEDPLELARSMGVEIRGPQTPGAQRRRGELDLKLNTLRAKGDDALKPVGVSLLDFVKSEGGIADVGGDVEAMDAPKGVIGETRAEYLDRKNQPNLDGSAAAVRAAGLDEMARKAIEAGYFPELMGGADIQADGTVVDEAAVLLEALQRAISGEGIYPEGEGPDADLVALRGALSERGIDIGELSNDEIAAALDEVDGREFDQRDDLARIIANGAIPDEIIAHPAVRDAVSDLQSRPETFGPDVDPETFFRSRSYVSTDGREIVGSRSVLDEADRIGAEYAGGDVRQERRLDLVIGPPAAGKSTVSEAIARQNGARIVDGDDIKKLIPEYDGGLGAMAVHEESSVLARQSLARAISRGDNIVLPKVGDNAEKLAATIAELKESGYIVNVVNMRVAPDEAFRRNVQRFMATGRLVPPEYLQAVAPLPGETYAALKEREIADGYAEIDNGQPFGQEPTVIEGSEVVGQPDWGLVPGYAGAQESAGRSGEAGPRLNTDTPAFREWFGDSKVVDADGEPLVVYHGSNAELEVIEPGRRDPGAWFTSYLQNAANYAQGESAAVHSVYLSMQNPLEVRMDGDDFNGFSVSLNGEQFSDEDFPDNISIVQEAQDRGHDGVIFWGGNFTEADDTFVAFEPTQIKSVYNRGTFDGSDPRILYQADAEFADLKAAKAEADRLLDAMSDGGDASAAFEAFGNVADKRDQLAKAIAKEDGGIELSNAKGDLFAAVTKSQDGGDGWRVTFFNKSGFLGHTEHAEKLAAVEQALEEGYTTEAKGALRNAMKARTFFQAAYHGTPHKFDKFSTAAMGTGEGAQAFGWGLYFASRKGVAEFYRDKLSKGPTLLLDGEQVGSGYIGHKLAEYIKTAIPPKDTDFVSGFETYSAYLNWFKLDAIHAMERLESGSGLWTPRQAFGAIWDSRLKADPPYEDESESVAKMTDAALDFFDQVSASQPGRLYKVDVPENSDLLDWDKPLLDQPEAVRVAIGTIADVLDDRADRMRARSHAYTKPVDDIIEGWTGRDLYDTVKDYFTLDDDAWRRLGKGPDDVMNVDQAASEFLRNAGIPGHRFLDGGSRKDGEGSHNYVIYDDEAIKILEFEQQKRGSIVLPSGGLANGQTVINLFESANLSTFLHESGHFFLEAFTALASSPDAPQAMRDDLAAINAYLGNEGGAFTTEQHETWARGFEAYAMEGKAPSLELADAFGRFKAWLTRIYRSIKGLNVKLTPEIREVMDRMLATDAEIESARDMQQMSPLFTDQAAAGMSDAAWATYQRMARRSEEQASQVLLEKTMAKVRREKEKWWKDERKQVRAEVATTVNSRREYRLIEMLANQNWIGSEDDVPDFQLDRKELVEAFGEGVLPELSRTKFGGRRAIYGADGVSLREAAEFFGFSNPSEMIETLQNTGKRQDAIELETDRIMSDRYGDPLNDGTIEEEALAAIHSEQQAMTLASEVRHLAGQAGKPTRNMTAKVYRQRARMMLGRMTVKDAIRPDAFLAAERKAAKRAEDAFARVARGRTAGDALAAAAKHKEQQLLNHYLYLESRDLSKMVAAKREKMRDYNKKSVRQKLDGGYIEQIDALLSGYDFRVRSQGQVQRSENLRDFVERMTEEGRAGELAIDDRLMDEANRKHYSRLSVDELRGLFDTIANIDHMGRFKQKLQDAKDARDMDEVVSGILGEFNANVSGNPPNRTPTAGEARRKLGRDYLNTVLNADTLLREVDGFKDLGPTWTAMKSRVDAGMNRLTERRVEMAKSFDAIYGAYSAKEKRDMAVKRHNDALGGLFSKWDLISLALNTGNDDNFERLTNPKIKGHFNRADIEAALSALDDRDWQTVQNIWDYIDGFWPEIAAKEKRQTGLAPEKVLAKQIVTAPGFVKGGYYPIKYDSRLSGLASDFKQKDLAQEIMGGKFGKAQTRNGHTKERGKTATQPVTLDLGIAHAHVDQVLYDLEIGEAVNNSWKILHDPRIREAFTEKGKQSDFDALEIWLQDVAAGERVAAGGLQSIMRHVRLGFVISRLALNVSTALIQPTGLVQSAVLIGKRAVATGTVDYMSNIPRWVREVSTVSSMMRERQKTFERDIFNVVGDLETGPVTGRWAKFQRDVLLPLSFVMMQKVQFYAVDMPTWVSAYQKEVKASGNEQKAREYADLMVKRAQGSGLMSDRGMLERGTLNKQSRQQELPRMFTALGSYMFAKGNVFYEKASQTDFKNPVQVMSLAADVALLFTLEAVLYSAVKGYLPGEDEDEPIEIAGWLGAETLYSMGSTLPYLREATGALQGFNSGGIFGSGIDAIVKPITQSLQGDADKALVKSFMDAGGVMLHLPASQSKAVIDSVFDADMSLNDEIDPLRAIGLGGGKGRSLADMMFGN